MFGEGDGGAALVSAAPAPIMRSAALVTVTVPRPSAIGTWPASLRENLDRLHYTYRPRHGLPGCDPTTRSARRTDPDDEMASMIHSNDPQGLPPPSSGDGGADQWAGGPAAAPAVEAAIDWEGLRKRYRNNPAFVGRIAAATLKANGAMPARLRQWAAEGNLTEIGNAAHALKGDTGNLMAFGTSRLAETVQVAARGGAADAADLALRLADALEVFLAAIVAEMPPPVPAQLPLAQDVGRVSEA